MKTITETIIFLYLLVLAVGCSSNKVQVYDKTPEEITNIDNKLERVVSTFMGHYSNRRQIDSSTTEDPLQGVIFRRIWQDRVGEYWACGSWYLEADRDNPMILSIANYKQIAPDTFMAYAYVIPDIEKNKKEWLKKYPFDHMSPKDLDPKLCFTNTYVYQQGKPIRTVNDKTGPAVILSEVIKFQKMAFSFTPSTFTVKSSFMDKDQNVLKTSFMYFDRIAQSDPRYYAPIREYNAAPK